MLKLALESLISRIHSRIGRRNLKLASLVFIIASLFLPVFWGSEIRGIQALCFGWICWYTMDVIPALVWIANPILFLSLIISPKRRTFRLVVITLALLFAAMGIFITRLPQDDYIHYSTVLPSFGYIVWIIGVLGIFLYHLERWKSKNA